MARTSATEMFSGSDRRRVRVGVHEDNETGIAIFGTWVEENDWNSTASRPFIQSLNGVRRLGESDKDDPWN